MIKYLNKILKVVLFMVVIFIITIKLSSMSVLKAEDTNIVRGISGKNEVIPLNYHYIRKKNTWNKGLEILTQDKELTTYNVYEDEFERQMDLLIEQDVYFATLEEVNYFRSIGEFPDKCVWISFDDADITVYERAYPILKERGIPFTMFVIAGQVGNDDFNNLEICTWDQLREMRDSGLVSFGSHTYDMHYLEDGEPMFTLEHNYEDFYHDIIKSKEVLEEELDMEISSISYPFGETSNDVTKIVIEAGYDAAYILAPAPINKDSGAYYQSRYLTSERIFYELGLNDMNNKK